MEVMNSRYPYKVARLNKFPIITSTPNTTTNHDYQMVKDMIISGVVYEAENANFEDWVEFQVVHPAYGVLDRFGVGWYVSNNPVPLLLHSAKLVAGLILRVVYHSEGDNVARFKINLELYEETK